MGKKSGLKDTTECIFNVKYSMEDMEYIATCDKYELLSYLSNDPLEALLGIKYLVMCLEKNIDRDYDIYKIWNTK